jgi:glucosamine--fructose-6-phosphate aminotransferase (isomerizing)
MFSNQNMIEKINRDLKNSILSQPELPSVILENIQKQLEEKIDITIANELRKIYITGCGDSFFTGVAAEFAFLKFSGIDTQPVEALNFSRYLVDYAPHYSALIAISNSGRVSRTVEAALLAKEKMATWAITDAPGGKLAQASEQAFLPGIPPMSSGGAGTRSYLASLISSYALAIHLGKLNGNIHQSEAQHLYSMLDQVGSKIRESIELCSDAVKSFALTSKDDVFFFVGGGPNYGTALFGAAKLLEALSFDGVAVELEEWAHLQFHTTFENTPYILIASPGAAYDRVLEQARGIKDSGGKLAVVVDEKDREISAVADTVFRVAGPDEEAFSPLVYCLPLEILAVELAINRNRSMVMRLDERRKEINFRQIFHSNIKV